jgi:hypothetical protein
VSREGVREPGCWKETLQGKFEGGERVRLLGKEYSRQSEWRKQSPGVGTWPALDTVQRPVWQEQSSGQGDE